MLKAFTQLLGADAAIFRHYFWLTVAYALCCGVTTMAVLPVTLYLLANDLPRALFWLSLLVLGALLCWLWRYRVEHAGVRVGATLLKRTRQQLGEHVARLPVGWFTRQKSARFTQVVTQGVMSVAQVPVHVLTPVIVGILAPLVLLVGLFLVHWLLGLVALIMLPLLAAVMLLSARLSSQADAAFQRHFVDVSQRVVEFAQAQSVLRCFNGKGGGIRLLQQALQRQQSSSKRLIWRSAVAAVLNIWVVQLIFAVLFMLAVLSLNDHLVTSIPLPTAIGTALSLLLIVRFIDPLLEFAGYAEVLRNARGQLQEIEALLAAQPLAETTSPKQPQDNSLALENVYFRYTDDTPDVLKHVNLSIAAGSMTALIGESGSGKTTLLQLFARYFDATRGRVLIGNVDVRQLSYQQLRGQISQIFQDSYLFAGTIADNIRIAKPNASDAEIAEVIELAGVSEMLERLPKGLLTPVGDGGTRISGGERQRVAIARALLKDAPILLVDEATAAMDAENQAVIADTLRRLRGKRTVVVIAHQLSTIAMADQIVVLQQGQVVEQGTPQQLRQQAGQYAHFLAQRKAAKGWRIDNTNGTDD